MGTQSHLSGFFINKQYSFITAENPLKQTDPMCCAGAGVCEVTLLGGMLTGSRGL